MRVRVNGLPNDSGHPLKASMPDLIPLAVWSKNRTQQSKTQEVFTRRNDRGGVRNTSALSTDTTKCSFIGQRHYSTPVSQERSSQGFRSNVRTVLEQLYSHVVVLPQVRREIRTDRIYPAMAKVRCSLEHRGGTLARPLLRALWSSCRPTLRADLLPTRRLRASLHSPRADGLQVGPTRTYCLECGLRICKRAPLGCASPMPTQPVPG